MESEAVLGAIRAARVPYPRDDILNVFIKRAADPERATQHIRARCGAPDGVLARSSLEEFLVDWEELIGLCEWPWAFSSSRVENGWLLGASSSRRWPATGSSSVLLPRPSPRDSGESSPWKGIRPR